MKTRSILMTALCPLMLGMGFVSCADDFEDEISQIPEEEAQHLFNYVLNEGAWGANNANISGFVYRLTNNEMSNKELIAQGDLYLKENQKLMGDVANAMMEEDNNIYVVLNGSKYVAKLNPRCKEEARYTFPGEGNGKVREVVADLLKNGYDGGFSMEPHMGSVFHDTDNNSADDKRKEIYIEYGRRFEKLIEELSPVK